MDVTNGPAQDAITTLNSLQTNFATVEAIRKSKSRDDMNKYSIPEAIEWLRRIGYQVRNLSLTSIATWPGGTVSTNAGMMELLALRFEPLKSGPCGWHEGQRLNIFVYNIDSVAIRNRAFSYS